MTDNIGNLPLPEGGSDSTATAAAHFEERQRYYKSAKACLGLLQDGTDFNIQAGPLIEALLEREPEVATQHIDATIIQIYINALPTVSEILTIEFYQRPAAPIPVSYTHLTLPTIYSV